MEVKDFPAYEIYENGQVYSYNRNQWLIPCISKRGYLKIWLYKSGKRYGYLVHRLVALHFVEGYFEEATVDHIDGNIKNNHYQNLRWMSHSENSRIAKIGAKNPQAKLTEEIVQEIKIKLAQGFSSRRLAKMYGISRWVIQDITYGKTWNHVTIKEKSLENT